MPQYTVNMTTDPDYEGRKKCIDDDDVRMQDFGYYAHESILF